LRWLGRLFIKFKSRDGREREANDAWTKEMFCDG